MTKFNKLWVAIAMSAIHFINHRYNWNIPVDQDWLGVAIEGLTPVFVYLIPNKRAPKS